MGEAKRKAGREADAWVALFRGTDKVQAALSRAPHRTAATRELVNQYQTWAEAQIQAGEEPRLCANCACEQELSPQPAALIFARSVRRETLPVMVGFCDACAQRSDAGLLVIAQDMYVHAMGSPEPLKRSVEFAVDLAITHTILAGGQTILVAQRDAPPGGPLCGAAMLLGHLLETRRLPRFTASRHQRGNCHVAV